MRDRIGHCAVWTLTLALLAVVVIGVLSGSRQPRDRVYSLEQRLRCPTCQSVSVAESPSDTAAAMRSTIRQQVTAGRSDQEILAYFRQRYGSWILFDPPAAGATLLVWLLPVLAAGVAAVVLAAVLRKRPTPRPLSTEESQRVRREADRLAATASAEEEEP